MEQEPVTQALRRAPVPNAFPIRRLPTQPSEPTLFPKLRIYFADFPYLHCSIN
jgi:hypothetical protein